VMNACEEIAEANDGFSRRRKEKVIEGCHKMADALDVWANKGGR